MGVERSEGVPQSRETEPVKVVTGFSKESRAVRWMGNGESAMGSGVMGFQEK